MLDQGNKYRMNWDCDRDGCFNKLMRPKFAAFADCFPNKINFSDMDGVVELNSRGLMLEWKSIQCGQSIKTGQRIMFERFTKGRALTVICIVGNAETMEGESYCLFYNGKQTKWCNATLEIAKERIRRWVKWAQAQKKKEAP